MSLKLIIAEKPSLARNIVSAINKDMKKRDGYYEDNDYLVTYAFGHLFSLYDIEQYQEDYDSNKKYNWTLDNLPFFPTQFRFGLSKDDGVIKQFKIIRSLINRDDVDTIINAGDSDREGEIIIRIILSYALKSSKSIKRLWMPDQTPKTILEELSKMRDDKEFDSLANEGYARTYIDWCYGINLTRLATIKAHTLLRVGRVIAPIVKAIYEREQAIVNFVPKKYYIITSKEKTNDEEIELTSKLEFPLEKVEEAKKYIDVYNNEKAIVSNIVSEEKIIPPGKLFSLSKLQGELGKKYKMTLDHSLAITQTLYEKGYVSYPRTPSQYLAENEKGKFKEIINNFTKLGVDLKFKDSKQIFDDSKIESHSALTPTYKIPKKSDLSNEEYLVYKTILNRFFSVFCNEPFKINRTNIEITLGDKEKFKISGDVVLNKGWTKFEEREKKDKILPNLKVGDEVNKLFKLGTKETKPPKRYTVETFNNFLKNPFKDNLEHLKEQIEDESIDADDSEEIKAMFEGIELGTEATRSGIIDNAIKQRYISLTDNTYKLEPLGKYYVETLDKLNMLLAKEKTAEIGKSLKKVYRNEINIDEAVKICENEIKTVFDNCTNDIILDRPPRIFEVEKKNVLCKCPKCGNIIAINEFGYRCNNTGCGLALYNSNKLFETLNIKLTKSIAKEIFTKGKIHFDNLMSKKGTTYQATLVADFSSKYVSFKFQFDNNEQ